jgi:hypothetical protein
VPVAAGVRNAVELRLFPFVLQIGPWWHTDRRLAA